MSTEPATTTQNLEGNEACALGAIAGGCRFYAGYPITPSSEIAERMASELPGVGGVFIQMEDEIASMAAILGASMGGLKVMTATSGPGFSLKQENLGLAVATEIPCVIIDVMRGGPSTGLPTRPAQGDYMQARWGTHGDHAIIVLTPASVAEIYAQTIRAFNLAEAFRTPVVILYEETIGHLRETVDLPAPETIEIIDRQWAAPDDRNFLPYRPGTDGIPAMPRPGDGHRTHMTGLTHGEDGFPTQKPEAIAAANRHLSHKLEPHLDRIEQFEIVAGEDAEVIVVACGLVARAAKRAVAKARAKGIRAGLFRPITLWPFPTLPLQALLQPAGAVIVAEMNAGQLIAEVERHAGDHCRVVGLNRIDGEAITPSQILQQIEELAND
ncbi:MAG: 2-oxoacid:acceptor oxidoreductase subunit alpha [Gammaproteobacteria bacterium]|jgi:2-oxoglutarate ferredoxin oxidoreductase subunit alpha|nr:MAG: 2-oxoacid:acceptor oxidoreductase subunit alpha [Gammaproteobacteria bacterium]